MAGGICVRVYVCVIQGHILIYSGCIVLGVVEFLVTHGKADVNLPKKVLSKPHVTGNLWACVHAHVWVIQGDILVCSGCVVVARLVCVWKGRQAPFPVYLTCIP